MPITKSAIKALRQDRKRTVINQRVKTKLKTALDKLDKDPSIDNRDMAYQALDRAAKAKIIHPNKAARIKSQANKKTIKSSK